MLTQMLSLLYTVPTCTGKGGFGGGRGSRRGGGVHSTQMIVTFMQVPLLIRISEVKLKVARLDGVAAYVDTGVVPYW